MFDDQVSRAKGFYKTNEKYAPAAFFVAGFLFDAITVERINEPFALIQQFLYIFLSALILSLEIFETDGRIKIPERFLRLWRYRTYISHFILGTLMNMYSIFYFKSGSIFSSFFFLSFWFALIIVNESHRFQGIGYFVRATLLSLCMASFLVCIVPVVTGRMGIWVFLLSVTISAWLLWELYRVLLRWIGNKEALRKTFLLPILGTHLFFILAYFLHLIPPVPLSIERMGIYHHIGKLDGKYVLTATRPRWKFWQKGDQSFSCRPGDAVFAFVSIFSPTGFKDTVNVRWLRREGAFGWTTQDKIPMAISGGREEGFRGFAVKQNTQPGHWRVQVETLDGRELGRIYFTIENAAPDAPTASWTEDG